jgi:phospholipid/cholesterol/gamma-HCH transport system substrate-binding protein
MEPKQNYLIVGIFVVMLAVGLMGFTVWLSDDDKNNSYTSYQTFIRESVNGLTVGSTVKYRGVIVGKVTKIAISKADPAKIHIVMQVQEGTPITVGTVAVLQMQGITGISYIELRGAAVGAEPIPLKGKNKIPVIPSAPSEFRQIVDTVPDMLQKFSELADKLGGFAADENQQRFASILQNMDTFSAQVGGADQDGKTLAQNMQEAVAEIKKVAAALNSTVGGSREDTRRILKNSVIALEKITKLTETTTQLSQDGYSDLQELQVELKKTARDLQSLSRNLKENPSQIIIPPQSGGVKVK